MTRIAVAATLLSATLVIGWASPSSADGATQVSGLGLPGAPGAAPCDDAEYADAHYAIGMVGDLEGCIYGYITDYRFHPSGTYQEYAEEIFVGSYGSLSGTFELTEFFTAKFDADGNPVWGRCKHPIVTGSGTGDFAGLTGRLDFKDDIEAGSAPYKGHLRFG
ncbi:MAG: DUF3224 domain-containing protein [Acidimicrobiia bacterium]|nr:DUF3224 domain-containing protein [Acidimicrobiia bacterium]